jgi:hypothetical protein
MAKAASDIPGHVFVAHGRLESVVHDVTVIPTDAGFSVERHWTALLDGDVEENRPASWPAEFAAGARAGVWFVDVGDGSWSGIEALAERAARMIGAIAGSGVTPGPGLIRPRIAMPVLGLEGGGLGDRRGDVLAALLSAVGEAAEARAIDVVVVTPDPAVFSAAQHLRATTWRWPFDHALLEDARRLGTLSREGHLALFLGAGVSVPAGLPNWSDLLGRVAERGGVRSEDLAKLPALDQAEVLQKRLEGRLGALVAAIAAEAQRPSLAHVLLAGLRCQQVVTTNYDRLYEWAAAATGVSPATVLPVEAAQPRQPWVLKMHGDVEWPERIVLTRRHFVRYDALTRPAGSLLQSLLLTKHLLVVGASLNDDNVARLTHEVAEFRQDSGVTGQFGTFLDIDDYPAKRELWSDKLHWIPLGVHDIRVSARRLEIFLDAVAMYAAVDSPWLLDPRFAGLLSEEGRELACAARALHRRAQAAAGSNDHWLPLVQALGELGADREA